MMSNRNGADDGGADLPTVVAGGVTTVTLLLAFGLLAAGWSSFWIVFPVGFGGVLPLAVTLAKRYETRSTTRTNGETTGSGAAGDEPADDAIDALRERYARGEIDEAEFERRVERLLETESRNARGASEVTAVESDAPSSVDDEVVGSTAEEGERTRESERR